MRGLRTASGRMGGDFRHLVTGPILQLEFAPYLNRIISPPIRPVTLYPMPTVPRLTIHRSTAKSSDLRSGQL